MKVIVLETGKRVKNTNVEGRDMRFGMPLVGDFISATDGISYEVMSITWVALSGWWRSHELILHVKVKKDGTTS